ncbi:MULTISPECIES: hypothetical protein [unclassified Okeania]|uniref:hypothetical protein n=1 Tax=unclassified Okeania TaxID=2634635 RepID=UPI0013C9B41E|nr:MULTISPECIES: hypothetical protein [unclassified Okeania]NET11524.1 hypothetical protein [Okeania sp. SIO1H6]NET93027.1 hypothetical protein [Okeania sp. SIO1H2]
MPPKGKPEHLKKNLLKAICSRLTQLKLCNRFVSLSPLLPYSPTPPLPHSLMHHLRCVSPVGGAIRSFALANAIRPY